MGLRFSVVTPSYQQAEFLEKTIQSVLTQSYGAAEYFVMDGGSSDGSREIIASHAAELSGWVSAKDRGQADAINQGFARATGDIFGWINSDDFYLAGAFERVNAVFEARPDVGFVFGDVLSVDRNGELMNVMRFGDWDWRDLARFRIISQPAVFFRRSLWEKCGGLDLSYHYLLDHQLWLRMVHGTKILYLPEPLAAARFYAEAKNRAHCADFGREAMRIATWLEQEPAFSADVDPIRREIRGGASWLDANYLSVGGDSFASLRAYGKAFGLVPARVVSDWRRILLTAMAIISPKFAEKIFAAGSVKRLSSLDAYRKLLD